MKIWCFDRRRAREDRFVALVFPHLRPLYRLAYRLTGSADEAEDLIQDTLAALLPQVAELDAVARLRPWLAKVLYRRFVDGYRRQQRCPVNGAVSLDDGQDAYLSDAGADLMPDLDNTARLDLQRALLTLPESWRNTVLLHDVEGYTAAEVADILGTETGTVKSRLHRARKKLQQLLGAEAEILAQAS
ncbi:RNA polymerase sigma factor [Microbulbifer harenosus]|uniref:RNA polymerase sigma factor n=1 Tax=Microbulbifer harenosus TaxID=2576840 RepID=UPI0014857A0B|nr:RNA polymerase sigma factor [Microbulbifer harenosus]